MTGPTLRGTNAGLWFHWCVNGGAPLSVTLGDQARQL